MKGRKFSVPAGVITGTFICAAFLSMSGFGKNSEESERFEEKQRQMILFCGKGKHPFGMNTRKGSYMELVEKELVPLAKSEITIEAGSGMPGFEEICLWMDTQERLTEHNYIVKMQPIETDKAAEQVLKVRIDGNSYEVLLHIVDTTAPDLKLKNVTVYTTEEVDLEDFVETVSDYSQMRLEYGTEPELSEPGEYEIVIKATDAYGNRSEKSAVLTVLQDVKPPVISGIKDYIIYEGELPDFMEGVEAQDEHDGPVKVSLDTSVIDVNRVGNYELLYQAVDVAGNLAKESAAVTVLPKIEIIEQPVSEINVLENQGLTECNLQVACILQNPELPTGCEVTSLAIALNYLGIMVDKCELADQYLEKTEDPSCGPNVAFLGNPRNQHAYGCYAPVIVNAAERYLTEAGLQYKAYNLTGTSFESLYEELEEGNPVIIWATMEMQKPYDATGKLNGITFPWLAKEHCLVLTGFNRFENIVYVADPLQGNVSYRLDVFKNRYEKMGSGAVVIK